jgi:hypothetical protein
MSDADLRNAVADRVRHTMLHRRYIEGGGSEGDFVTDLQYVIDALEAVHADINFQS